MKITEEIKISDNGFVFNSKTGDSFTLNPFGLELIKKIQEGKDFETFNKGLLEKYEVDDLTLEKDYYEFCALLKHHQIISQDDSITFR